jgi:hypothetical protein
MPIAFRDRSAPAPALSPLPGLVVRQERNAATMAALQKRSVADIQARFDGGNRAYVAELDGVAAAWGWVATDGARIGEVGASFHVAPRERYLWNFVTLAEFRGRGIYPRLINVMVEAELADGDRFWIAYAPENHASGAGIAKAGFELVADLSFDRKGLPVVRDIRTGGGSQAAELLGLREIREAVAKCWKCARGAMPEMASCASEFGGQCCCDYQKPDVECEDGAWFPTGDG